MMPDRTDHLPVYIVHFNAPLWCRTSVDSILASTGLETDVTVLNNGGALAMPATVRVVEMSKNVGFTGAANYALREWLRSDSEWCAVTAHDLVVEPGTLAQLVELGSSDPTIGLVGPSLWEAGWRIGGWHQPQDDPFIDATWISGSCLVIRRRCIEAIGLFDERLGSYCEDVDLSYRARGAGWRVGIARDAPARQLGTAHLDAGRVLIERNWVLVRRKHAGWLAGLRRVGHLAAGATLLYRRSRRAEGFQRLRALPGGIRFLFIRLNVERGSR